MQPMNTNCIHMVTVSSWGIPLIPGQWCLDMNGSGQWRAGLCYLTCDGGRGCATATHCLISCVQCIFSYFFISFVVTGKDESYTLHSLAVTLTLSQAVFAVSFAYTNSTARPSLHYHP